MGITEMLNKSEYRVGQIVKCGGTTYRIETVSPKLYLLFTDGSAYYVMTLRRCGGEWNDVLFVNDAQIEVEE